MVYYQQQNVALLAQISKQLSSITPQVIIPSDLPTPYPSFHPKSSDVRVNVFWFMSLVFSLSAALLATLVQQWVRDYMHVFQRYDNPLKSTRLRQYLNEGVEGWYMPIVAEFVPGFVHISLFLFFVGVGDTLLSINTTVAVTTIVPITICGLLYVLSMFAPVINPQSPFRNPFSGLIWYMKQKVHPRRYLDRASGGSLKAASSVMSEGQMQLAMEENDQRKGRDIRAIEWLIRNRTEDDEMEPFVVAIPGTFTSKWGAEVWRSVSEGMRNEGASSRPNDPPDGSQEDANLLIFVPSHHGPPPLLRASHPRRSLLRPLRRNIGTRSPNVTTHVTTVTHSAQAPDDATGDLAIYDLCKRVRRLLDTCDNRSLFVNEELWLKRARGCVETVATLVVCADIKLEPFGDLGRLLTPLHQSIMGRYHTAPGTDGLFVARLDCLSFVIVNRGMANHDRIKLDARAAIEGLSRFGMGDESGQSNNGNDDENALRNARRIDHYFENARQFCVFGLREAFRPSEVGTTEEQVREVLSSDHKVNISMLEHVALGAEHMAEIDRAIFRINDHICAFANGLILFVRGAHFDVFEQTEHVQQVPFFTPNAQRPTFFPQFIFLHQRLRLLCSYSTKLRDIIDGRGNGAYEEILKSLEALWGESDGPYYNWSGVRRRHLMERQLWRLQDLRDGGFGFWVEFFFLVVRRLLDIPLSRDAHAGLIVGTFRAITSNWRQHKHSIGTQRVILNIICDMAILDHGLLSDLVFPKYITDELLVLLEKMMEGQHGSHIDHAMKELHDTIKEQGAVPEWLKEVHMFRIDALNVLVRLRAPAPYS